MDVRLFISVIGRFKWLVLLGFIIGIALGVLSVTKVDIKRGRPSLTYRNAEEWATYSRVLLTAPSVKDLSIGSTGAGSTSPYDVQAQIQGSLPGLATIYATFVSSDGVRRILMRSGGVNGLLAGTPVKADPFGGGGYLPIVSIEAISDTPQHTVELGNRAVAAFAEYVQEQQAANGVQANARVGVSVLNRPSQVTLVRPHSKMLPAAVLMVVLFATIGLAFLLENLRPRVPLRSTTNESPTQIPPNESPSEVTRARAAS